MANATTSESNGSKAFSFSKVHHCRIHPGIGIARVGNSPDGIFIGPEAPRDPNLVAAPEGGFKDAEGRIKRQAARFRIYAYDEKGNNLGELPLGGEADFKVGRSAMVQWTVHLANKKGAWYKFYTRFERPGAVRNGQIPVAKGRPPDSRPDLVIDPGPRCIDGEGRPIACGSGPATARFDTGTFLGTTVPLGELRVDDGRLVVLGGFGHSASTNGDPIGADPVEDDYWANNDYWYDDISDGPVTARVMLPHGKKFAIEQPQDSAWVISAPPKYAAGINPIVSLYDVMREVALDQNWITDKQDVTYYGDIFPILSRVVGLSWVSQEAQQGHGYDKRGEFRPPQDTISAQTDEQSGRGSAKTEKEDGATARPAARTRIIHPILTSDKLATPEDEGMRRRIVARIRNPLLEGEAAMGQANAHFMPLLSGDAGDREEGIPETGCRFCPRNTENSRHGARASLRPAKSRLIRRWKASPTHRRRPTPCSAVHSTRA